MILILYAGGTIGMQEGPEGRILAAQSGSRLATMLSSLLQSRKIPIPDFEVREAASLFDSSDATPSDWFHIGDAIRQAASDFDGFVVLHGSDSLAWCASALAFQLQGLNKAVVVTGAQAPLGTPGREGDDALDNVVGSLRFAADPDLKEVGIYFGERLLRGCRSRKWYAQDALGFKSPNYAALGRGDSAKHTHNLDSSKTLRATSNSAVPSTKQSVTTSRVARIAIWPGILPELVRAWLLHEKVDGVVLECLGSGSLPDDADLLQTLRDASAAGKVIAMVSQCPHGTIEPELYASRRVLADAGVISGGDMTVEAAVCKLNYLFALQLDKAEIRRIFAEDLVGELSR